MTPAPVLIEILEAIVSLVVSSAAVKGIFESVANLISNEFVKSTPSENQRSFKDEALEKAVSELGFKNATDEDLIQAKAALLESLKKSVSQR